MLLGLVGFYVCLGSVVFNVLVGLVIVNVESDRKASYLMREGLVGLHSFWLGCD